MSKGALDASAGFSIGLVFDACVTHHCLRYAHATNVSNQPLVGNESCMAVGGLHDMAICDALDRWCWAVLGQEHSEKANEDSTLKQQIPALEHVHGGKYETTHATRHHGKLKQGHKMQLAHVGGQIFRHSYKRGLPSEHTHAPWLACACVCVCVCVSVCLSVCLLLWFSSWSASPKVRRKSRVLCCRSKFNGGGTVGWWCVG